MTSSFSDQRRAEIYQSHRDRSATEFKNKHLRQYDREFARLTGASPSMSVLEIGCGSGLFLRYLEARGYREIVGVDMDKQLTEALGDLQHSEIHLDDIGKILSDELAGRRFDRIVLLDLAEHLQLDVLVDLLKALGNHINEGGAMLLRVPNIESPWGLKMHFGTFDHVTPLTPGRMFELGVMSGWDCTGVHPQPPGRLWRRAKERLLASLLASLLSYRPDIWTANLLAVYAPRSEV
ncbi:MAG: methyltransferase domain-containing protein [Rhodospirillales bacterium]|jgi:cyclopropane fatty-acyl-phospholipid synthase-like methyltransferase|nr:methyltransferase domain-containing protein [Rhodospirillales bacterium]MDP6644488.1 methyltransferase domain-containing protein [Rhodospirillales bacterium]MDP6840215.1 methyltransferase domain-containing protein [Rhodospirillales bacterium]|tara:strand:+ start:813 stop:1520 length:708 start_codon:yes stop_codon:yes gene_type:complete